MRALIAKIWPDKGVQWCADGEFLSIFCVLHLQRAAYSTFQSCIVNSHYGHTMYGSIVGCAIGQRSDSTGRNFLQTVAQDIYTTD